MKLIRFVSVVSIAGLSCTEAFSTTTTTTTTISTSRGQHRLHHLQPSRCFHPAPVAFRSAQQPFRTSSSVFTTRTTKTPSSSLHLFNLDNTPPEKPTSIGEVLERLWQILRIAFNQFVSAYCTGYFMSAIWGIFRSPLLPGRGVRWGIEFGFLSAIFGVCSNAAQMLFGCPPNALWSVVIRNVILSIYFSRNSPVARILQNMILWGVLTFYFISQKEKRDQEFAKNNPNVTTPTTDFSSFFVNGSTQNIQQMKMAQLIKQMQMQAQQQQQQQQQQRTRPPNSTSSSSSSSSSSTAKPSSSPPKKKSSIPKDVVDVEFEPVETDDVFKNDNDNDDDEETKGEKAST